MRYPVRPLGTARGADCGGTMGAGGTGDDNSQPLLDAGADHVAMLLVESRNYLGGLLEMPRVPVPTPGIDRQA